MRTIGRMERDALVTELADRVAAAASRYRLGDAEQDLRQEVMLAALHEDAYGGRVKLTRESMNYYFKVCWRRAVHAVAAQRSSVSFPIMKGSLYRDAWRWMAAGGADDVDAVAPETAEERLLERERVEALRRFSDAMAEGVRASRSPNKRTLLAFVRAGMTPEALERAAAARARLGGRRRRARAARGDAHAYLVRRQVRTVFRSSRVAQEAAGVILAV